MAKGPLKAVKPGMKVCPKCGFNKPLSEFAKNAARRDGVQTYCNLCLRKYRAEHPADYAAEYARGAEKNRLEALARYWANPGRVREKRLKANRDPAEYARHKERSLQRGRQLRDDAMNAYGGYRCACCGESTPEFMTIDHIAGCGASRRVQQGLGQSLYAWLRRNGYPPGFRVLCYNCNLGRAKNGGVCPHEVAAVAK